MIFAHHRRGSPAAIQDCLLYAEGSADEEYYCADSCSPSPCEDGQVCLLQEVQCIRAPCPPFSACSDEDLCLGACGEFEVRRKHGFGTSFGAYREEQFTTQRTVRGGCRLSRSFLQSSYLALNMIQESSANQFAKEAKL